MTGPSARVVVGLPDADPAATEALLQMAATLHRQRHTCTTLVHAIGSAHELQPRPSIVAERHRRSVRLLHAAAKRLSSLVGYLARIEIVASTATPTAELINQSRDALLIVLRRGAASEHHGLRGGSVTSMVTARASCRVLVLRSDHPTPLTGPVVVGLTASRSSQAAVTAAFDEASWRGAELVVVHSWIPPDLAAWGAATLPGRPDNDGFAHLVASTRRLQLRWLAETLAGQSSAYPDVVVRHPPSSSTPVEALTQASGAAQLVVVGRHHRSAHETIGPGRVARGLLHRSHCPVLVAPTLASGTPAADDVAWTPRETVTPVLTGLAPHW